MDTTTETKVKVSAIQRLIKAGSKQIELSDIIKLHDLNQSFNISDIQTLIYTTAEDLSEKSAKEIILKCAKQSLLIAQAREHYEECRSTLNQATEQVEQYVGDKEELYKQIGQQERTIARYQSDIAIYRDVVKHLKIALVITIIVIIIVCTLGIII